MHAAIHNIDEGKVRSANFEEDAHTCLGALLVHGLGANFAYATGHRLGDSLQAVFIDVSRML